MFNTVQKLLLLILLAGIFGCGNADYVRNSDGLIFRVIPTGKGDLIKPKYFLKIHQSMEVGDSLFYSTFGKVPSYGLFDSMQVATHDFLDILYLMRKGDSAIVIRSVDTLVKRGALQYNEVFKKGGRMKVKIKVLEIFSTEEALQEDRNKEFDAFKKRDIEELKSWAATQNIKDVRSLPQGVLIKTEKAGSGDSIDSAMQVTVNYTGSLLNGKVFDSNVDSSFGHAEPFKFVVGMRQVIEGWDLAVKDMKVGEKARIFIPSHLAYGMQGSGPSIPPYSHLIFDIEVLKSEEYKPEEPPADQNNLKKE
jgi:FKBP-type peptidyl-prolyl cis-trans isomerase FkpA